MVLQSSAKNEGSNGRLLDNALTHDNGWIVAFFACNHLELFATGACADNSENSNNTRMIEGLLHRDLRFETSEDVTAMEIEHS